MNCVVAELTVDSGAAWQKGTKPKTRVGRRYDVSKLTAGSEEAGQRGTDSKVEAGLRVKE